MKKEQKKEKLISKILKGALSREADATSCIYIYEPKAPDDLKKYSKNKRR